MIKAKVNGSEYDVQFAINRGEWFGQTWLIQCANGFTACNVLVEADSASDAIDELADSKRSYLIDTEPCNTCLAGDYDSCSCDTAGNDNHPVNLENVWVKRCIVDYFAKPN